MARMTMVVFAAAALAWTAQCKPLDNTQIAVIADTRGHMGADTGASAPSGAHTLWKRFVDPMLSLGAFSSSGLSKMRTKRSSEENCERLQLCELHARAAHNFLAAYELYFVNKENARLWDHRAHSRSDCLRQFSHCTK